MGNRDAIYDMWKAVTLTWEEAWDDYLSSKLQKPCTENSSI